MKNLFPGFIYLFIYLLTYLLTYLFIVEVQLSLISPTTPPHARHSRLPPWIRPPLALSMCPLYLLLTTVPPSPLSSDSNVLQRVMII